MFCFTFSNIYKNRWPNSEEKLNFGDRLVLLSESVSPDKIW